MHTQNIYISNRYSKLKAPNCKTTTSYHHHNKEHHKMLTQPLAAVIAALNFTAPTNTPMSAGPTVGAPGVGFHAPYGNTTFGAGTYGLNTSTPHQRGNRTFISGKWLLPPDCRVNKCFFRTNEAIALSKVEDWIYGQFGGMIYDMSEVRYTIPDTQSAQHWRGRVVVVPRDYEYVFRYRFDCQGNVCWSWLHPESSSEEESDSEGGLPG